MGGVVLEMLADFIIAVLVLKCRRAAIRRVLLDSVLLAELCLSCDIDTTLHGSRHDAVVA